MRLDQFIYKTQESIPDVDFEAPEDAIEVKYFRKFNALHGMMEELYKQKGGADEDFNLVPVKFTLTEILTMLGKFYTGEAKPVEGFFFGAQEIYPEHVDALERFVNAMKDTQTDEVCEFYYSAWY